MSLKWEKKNKRWVQVVTERAKVESGEGLSELDSIRKTGLKCFQRRTLADGIKAFSSKYSPSDTGRVDGCARLIVFFVLFVISALPPPSVAMVRKNYKTTFRKGVRATVQPILDAVIAGS